MQPQDNPYQFITDAAHKPKKSLLPGGDSKKGRIIIVASLVLLLLIAGIIIASLISSASKSGQAEVLKAAQQQAELVRISKIGLDRAKSTSARNLAMTTNLSLQSDQATLTASLKGSGVKVNAKSLALGKDPKTDVILNTAEQANRFDEVFIETVQKELTEYQTTLKSAYTKTSSKKLKTALEVQFNNAGLLAKAKQ